jgi:hypothetical protein
MHAHNDACISNAATIDARASGAGDSRFAIDPIAPDALLSGGGKKFLHTAPGAVLHGAAGNEKPSTRQTAWRTQCGEARA